MSVAPSLIPGLDEVMSSADPARKNAAIRQIGQLFAHGAARFSEAHVKLFDDILVGLIPQSDPAVRAALASAIAPLPNAPPRLVNRLANDNLIAISGPLLGRSPAVTESMLVEFARIKGQPQLMAISGRAPLTAAVTDIIVRRGDRGVIRTVAANSAAAFSPVGFAGLIRRAEADGVLAMTVGQRDDLSDSDFNDLLAGSVDLVRRRILDGLSPARRKAIGQTLQARGAPETKCRDFAAAQAVVLALHRAGTLNEAALLGIAERGDYAATVAALAALSTVPIETIDRKMSDLRHDPLLVIGRAIGLGWDTVRALIAVRPGPRRSMSSRESALARQHYDRLLRPTAQRVLDLWRLRQPDVIAS